SNGTPPRLERTQDVQPMIVATVLGYSTFRRHMSTNWPCFQSGVGRSMGRVGREVLTAHLCIVKLWLAPNPQLRALGLLTLHCPGPRVYPSSTGCYVFGKAY